MSSSIAAVLVHTADQEASTSQAQQPAGAQPAVTEHLVLRLAPRKKQKKKGVKWAEGVVDNEHMNKRKSKKCCIFHKQRTFGDWSDDDSDVECPDCGDPQPGDEQPA
eukprot:scaffold20.g7687.t1